VITIGVCGLIGYTFRNSIVNFIQRPLGSPLYYTSPAGSFNFVMKLAFLIGVFIAIPVIIYHLIKFIEPALPIKIKGSFLIKVIGSSFILALMGAAFGYYLIIPMSLHFFNSYSTHNIKPLISTGEYLTFIINAIISFVFLFQIPLIILFINFIKPLKPNDLLRYQKHVIIGSLIIAVILPFTYSPIIQFVLAIPIIALYYLSILLLLFVNRNLYKSSIKSYKKGLELEHLTALEEIGNDSQIYVPTEVKVAPVAIKTVVKKRKVKTTNMLSIDGFIRVSHKNINHFSSI
jgi:sec-independent protein translocase protein TatC